MSKIIIPGQEKKPHIHDKIKELAEKAWSDQVYLQYQYEAFLKAIQQGSPKDYHYNSEMDYVIAGSPKWNEHDTFDDWMKDVEEMLRFRLHELQLRKENSSQSFPHLVTLVREAQEAGEADLAVEGIGESLSPEAYEAFEYVLRKSMETVQKYRRGEITLLPPNHVEDLNDEPTS